VKTSAQWWEEVRDSGPKLSQWLQKQYYGEVMAADRIIRYAIPEAKTLKEMGLLRKIAQQELDHAMWVGELLVSRGISLAFVAKETPYWDATLPQIDDLASATAVATLAEKMRLERIRIIATDPKAPEDIREVFLKILPQEEFHEQAFGSLTTEDALSSAIVNHELGKQQIGLVTIED